MSNHPKIIEYTIKQLDSKIAKLMKRQDIIEKFIKETEELKLTNMKLFLNSIHSDNFKKYVEKTIDKEMTHLLKKQQLLETIKKELEELKELRQKV